MKKPAMYSYPTIWIMVALLVCCSGKSNDTRDNGDAADTPTEGDAEFSLEIPAEGEEEADAAPDAAPEANDGTEMEAVADAVADAEADTASDATSDTEGGGCDTMPTGCCTETCPCPVATDRCVYSIGRGRMGVCKPASVNHPQCWASSDCEMGEYCAGSIICPCGSMCFIADKEGICTSAVGSCCSPEAECTTEFDCLVISGTGTCHAVLPTPDCWRDENCEPGGQCEDASLCNCMMDCLSRPGICRY